LKPPMRPKTSSTSPHRYSPGNTCSSSNTQQQHLLLPHAVSGNTVTLLCAVSPSRPHTTMLYTSHPVAAAQQCLQCVAMQHVSQHQELQAPAHPALHGLAVDLLQRHPAPCDLCLGITLVGLAGSTANTTKGGAHCR
jgi:hypothetical protein